MSVTNSFNFDNYSVVISLNERNIYIKMFDNINLINYESNFDSKELNLQLKNSEIYEIINNSLNKNQKELPEDIFKFNCKINVLPNFIKLTFETKIGFIEYNFIVMLKEKILSNDAQLTVNFNSMEQKYNDLLNIIKKQELLINKMQTEFEYKLEKISHADVMLIKSTEGSGYKAYGFQFCYPISSKTIEINNIENFDYDITHYILWNKIALFYNLNQLIIKRIATETLKNIKNSYVKILNISFHRCDMTMNWFSSFEGLNNMPNLEQIIITIPNNKFPKSMTTLIPVLSEYKHKIKDIKIIGTTGLHNKTEIESYCRNNDIKLALS